MPHRTNSGRASHPSLTTPGKEDIEQDLIELAAEAKAGTPAAEALLYQMRQVGMGTEQIVDVCLRAMDHVRSRWGSEPDPTGH